MKFYKVRGEWFPLNSIRKQEITKTRNRYKQDWFVVYAADTIQSGEDMLDYLERIYHQVPFHSYKKYPTIPKQLCSKTLLTYDNFYNVINNIKRKGIKYFYVTVDTVYVNSALKQFINHLSEMTYHNSYDNVYLFTFLEEVKDYPEIITHGNNRIISDVYDDIKLIYGRYYS